MTAPPPPVPELDSPGNAGHGLETRTICGCLLQESKTYRREVFTCGLNSGSHDRTPASEPPLRHYLPLRANLAVEILLPWDYTRAEAKLGAHREALADR